MKRVLIALILVCMFPLTAMAALISGYGMPLSDPALTGGTVIDFESQALGIYTALTIGDVTFTANNNHLQIDNTYQGYNQTGIYLDNGTYGNNGFGILTISFASAVNAFGFNWGMAEPFAQWTLNAYDSLNNLIDTQILPSTGASNAQEFYGISAIGISSAILSWTGDYDWVGIDNFTYTSSVPEPSTLLLLGSGLLGLGFFARKRMRK